MRDDEKETYIIMPLPLFIFGKMLRFVWYGSWYFVFAFGMLWFILFPVVLVGAIPVWKPIQIILMLIAFIFQCRITAKYIYPRFKRFFNRYLAKR